MTVRPVRVSVPEAELADLRSRLRRTRWPESATGPGWAQGVPLEVLQELCAYWAEDYDWRRLEARLDAVPQVLATVDGLDVHALHLPSPHPGAMPLVLTHGWPGSVVELLDVLGPLADPPAYGGNAADAFSVVCPSLPGYGWSAKPSEPGWGVERTADAWAGLMTLLGYDRFAAQGGDWGTSVSALIGARHPERVLGLCLVPPLAAPDPETFADLTGQERAALAALDEGARDGAYGLLHETRPQTVGYALLDSPAGLCAWILEKLWSWCDHPGDLYAVVPRDRVLDLVTTYWMTGTAASSARLYRESLPHVREVLGTVGASPVQVPVAGIVFPGETIRPSRRWAERRFSRIVSWSTPARGGHFPALEQPALFVDEVRAALRPLR
ncbi:pimeloyl-ACP methyl ester carboxylesterase [Motilibacter rhizosphaerae]|uniref:Pimeloyl-ACP methyl ester carboxylesterase n=1 Tax=Motilibacter rhizosphaerae TaxID=598652 RepID=A0A4Q7NAX2_9ACTN|nr:epoxide hydrolase family protein [Motilibacter rhizosphaerae]RZS79993.1 pimeloyl-ACP methyl ester carboxylesterase [Motilibacter rhizosphaerae]